MTLAQLEKRTEDAVTPTADPVEGPGQRMHIVLRPSLRATLQELADDRGVTVTELIRQFIKLGILAAQIEATPGASLLIKEGEEVTKLRLL